MTVSLLRRLALLAASTFLAQPALADGLIDGVNGYTLDSHGRLERFTGLLIGTDGKVKRLLDDKDKRPPKLDFKLDGRGRTLLPGLIDSHVHLMQLGLASMALDLSDTNSLAEAQDRLKRYAADHPQLRWITGFGWNQERWKLGRMPNAADLDAAVSDRPVWLQRVDEHAGVANTRAMEDAGVSAQTPVPPGGQIGGAGSKPDGFFADAAMALITKAVPAPTPRERDEALARAQDILLGYGLTVVDDMGTTPEDWNVLRRAGDAGKLKLRVISYAKGVDALLAIAGTRPTPWLYGSRLRMVGVKLYADGALGSRGAWLKQPYADRADLRGEPFLDDAKLRNYMSRAAMDGFQVAVHAIGDAANAQVLDAIDEVSDTYKADLRWRIEHAQIVDPIDIRRFGTHGIVASMQPVHQTSDRLMAEARLGPDRLAGAYAWASIAKAGAPLVFGSDAPVEKPDPFAGMAAAITRQDAAGEPAGGWQPQEKVSLLQAFTAYTAAGAYAGFAEDRLGTLQPGQLADFVLIDRDPFTSDPQTIRGTQVIETWVAGVRAWVRGGRPTP